LRAGVGRLVNRDFTVVADSRRRMVEQRAKRRQKTLLHGFVYFDDSPCAVECVVREISEAGARLKFELPPAPVEAFELDLPLRGRKLRAAVKWQRGSEVGVVFAEGAPASGAPTPAAPASTEDLGLRVLRLETEIAALGRLVKRLQQKVNNKVEAA
jgi:PilZ domain